MSNIFTLFAVYQFQIVVLMQLRKELGQNLAPAETFLWNHLKAKQPSVKKFVKQQWYLLQIFLARDKLITELDGAVRQNPTMEAYDKERTELGENMQSSVT